MPWKAASPVDLRIELMKRLAAGEKPADLRREYGISKKTVNKFRIRFKARGLAGLEDQSRAPHVIPHKTPAELEELIVAERKKHMSWGPKKLKDVLEKRLERQLPSASTVGHILLRRGLIEKRQQRPRFKPSPTGLREPQAPNDIWCIDYKGQFRLGDRTYCYPLTLTDQLSRFILACEGMAAISDEAAREACEEVFRTYGLPTTMRSDNGVPFASTGLCGLTRLSVFWMRLDIQLERIRPAHPEENGRHERMHRTLKQETTRPARGNLLQQQERFDDFVEEFNQVRPHEALAMKRPSEVYTPSTRAFPRTLPELEYPMHDDTVRVTRRGWIHVAHHRTYLTTALVGENVGIREQSDGRWLVTFKELDLGHLQADSFVPINRSVPPGGD